MRYTYLYILTVDLVLEQFRLSLFFTLDKVIFSLHMIPGRVDYLASYHTHPKIA